MTHHKSHKLCTYLILSCMAGLAACSASDANGDTVESNGDIVDPMACRPFVFRQSMSDLARWEPNPQKHDALFEAYLTADLSRIASLSYMQSCRGQDLALARERIARIIPQNAMTGDDDKVCHIQKSEACLLWLQLHSAAPLPEDFGNADGTTVEGLRRLIVHADRALAEHSKNAPNEFSDEFSQLLKIYVRLHSALSSARTVHFPKLGTISHNAALTMDSLRADAAILLLRAQNKLLGLQTTQQDRGAAVFSLGVKANANALYKAEFERRFKALSPDEISSEYTRLLRADLEWIERILKTLPKDEISEPHQRQIEAVLRNNNAALSKPFDVPEKNDVQPD